MPARGGGERIAVIGLGNVLMRDEGVGIRALERLPSPARPLPGGVAVIEAGLGGLNLLDIFPHTSKAIIIDAARMNRPPGTVRRFQPEELAYGSSPVGLSCHNFGLLDIFELARNLGTLPPRVVVIGIEPKEISWGNDLSSEVAAALPSVIELIWDEILAV